MIRLMIVSDMHFGAEDVAALAAAAQFCAQRRPDAVLVAGDVSSQGRRREMAAAAAWLRALNVPIIATPGNHDSPYWSALSRLARPFRRFERAFAFGPAGLARASIQTLNTARGVQVRRLDWSLGVADLKQTRRIAAAFSQLDASVLRVAMAHHPLVAPPNFTTRTDTRRGPQAAQILIDGGVDVIVSGHLHVPFVAEIASGQGTYAVGSGTLSHRVRGAPPGFTTLDTPEPERARVTFWACEGGPARVWRETTVPLRPGRLRLPAETPMDASAPTA